MKRFFRCKKCGNLMKQIVDGGNSPVCCGRKMQSYEPQDYDNAGSEIIDCTLTKGSHGEIYYSAG